MSPTPEDPKPSGSGFTVRAKARVAGAKVRPEVASALGDLERSLADAATWGALQPPEVGSEAEPGVDGPVALPPGIPPPPGAPVPIVASDDEPDDDELAPPPPVEVAPAPLLSRFADPDEIQDVLVPGPAVLAGAVDVAAGVTQSEADAEEARRRQRNGRVLTWAGALLIAFVAAIAFVPGLIDSDDPATGPSDTTSTTDDGLLLDPQVSSTTTAFVTSTTMAPITVPPVVATTPTPTTAKPKPKPPTTNAPATTAPTAPTTTQAPLQNPGCVGETCRTTRTSQPAPTTPTTAAPVTEDTLVFDL